MDETISAGLVPDFRAPIKKALERAGTSHSAPDLKHVTCSMCRKNGSGFLLKTCSNLLNRKTFLLIW
ncbi:MAG: hypothetical protein ACLPTZ_23500 [Beijerinckiaceae bacterium]